MIIWINGAFGAGKTQTALELCARIPNSFLYDPENIGYWLWDNEPESLKTDNFQKEPMWRKINRDMLYYLSANYREGPIVVPMTLIDPEYYREIIGVLRADGVAVRHFLLWAEAETIRQRLRSRHDFKDSWAARQLPVCLKAFSDSTFENRIQTDGKTVSEVAEKIAEELSLTLIPRK